ncbi:MAG: sodium:solute symporter [Limnobacter sp.]|jgi:solute:Na+ symporter, SSS family|uniref:Sodium:solute symporter family protein n=2 Tax=Limnobacter TaxID=131079 RepID=A0ABX6N398_9BURK|nr:MULTISPECIES: sodium:solute symporter family protein [unclassified Limnobacter]MAG81460.1 sodium:solute symporter [Sutterellaceae bacterium]PZO18013.1 MAG: sodium:solute symporter [Betaproteobacteria bacterium]MDZ4049494.1 sodium:solute symporter family protein [Limnobacter sp.]PZO25310.1 MAG: sodium:solute symporter [Betaproteobacteria bacterium]PZO31394.1 MAG: sodium:solute symporter [Betaproteobacteria bacterium]|tara:strand:- start:3133 stop:4578 length:1446 start_codon:yes stop_codon:yes gene_type:complete
MLLASVVAYLLVSVLIGLYVARNVSSAADYAVAGRHLSLPIVTATVFATWFGSETVLGISSTFVEEGLSGIVADPFGASMCLILAGLFIAPKIYRLNLLTLGDYYRVRYNRVVEIFCSACIVVSYLGWVAAQISALGLIFNVLTDGAVSQEWGMVIGASVVLIYTLFGGMLSVAILDFIQMVVIAAGLVYIMWIVADLAGGVGTVVDHAEAAGKLQFFPEEFSYVLWVPFVGAFLTMAFGSIPQQDIFQRISSAKDEKTAVRGAVLGGSMYFFFAFIPVFLAYGAILIDPATFTAMVSEDSQMVLPNLVLMHTPVFAQIVFFGALISAIMSTSSATLLAPSVSFAENIVKNIYPKMDDKALLLTMRISVFVFTIIVVAFAINSESSIFEMVESAYEITLAAAFVPLVFGLYWSKATSQGAVASIVVGVSSWLIAKNFFPSEVWPPQLLGMVLGLFTMIIASLLPQWIEHRPALRDGVVHLH